MSIVSPITNCPYNHGLAKEIDSLVSTAASVEAQRPAWQVDAFLGQLSLRETEGVRFNQMLARLDGATTPESPEQQHVTDVQGFLHYGQEGVVRATPSDAFVSGVAQANRDVAGLYYGLQGLHDSKYHRNGGRCPSQGSAHRVIQLSLEA